MSISKRYESQMRKETVSMLEDLLRRLKNGTMVVQSKGMWKGVTEGKYTYRVDVINRREAEDSEES